MGAVMTCFPIFYAVIENDLRRVLAYSMINQIGFMVCGIGIGTELAVNGAVAHAFNDVIFKGLLMMSMGAVLHMTGRINGSELGGLYKSMPITTVLCIVGAASISAFPLFSGFVSKSMVMSAALSEGYHWVWLALLFASAGVFHHAGIKIPFFAFFAHDSGIRTTEPPVNMLVAMAIAAFLCVLIGCYPRLLYDLLPFATEYTAYDTTHVLAQLQILFFSALAFAWLKLSGLYPPELPSVNIDVEWVYPQGRVAGGAPSALRRSYGLRGDRQRRRPGRTRGLGEWARRSFGPVRPPRRGLGHQPDGDRDDRGAVRIPGVAVNAVVLLRGEPRSRGPALEPQATHTHREPLSNRHHTKLRAPIRVSDRQPESRFEQISIIGKPRFTSTVRCPPNCLSG